MEKELVFILVSLLFSAFFSAVEIAFISVNRLHIRLQSKQTITDKILLSFSDKSSFFIASILIGNTIALALYSIFMANLLEPFMKELISSTFPLLQKVTVDIISLPVQTLLATVFVLALAEFLPKSFALINPYRLLKISAFPMKIIYIVFYPATYIVIWLCKFLFNRILAVKYVEEKQSFGLIDLKHYITGNSVKEHEKGKPLAAVVNQKIFSNALAFKSVKIRECMIPRKEIVAIDVAEDTEKLLQTSIKKGHSKILVYENSIDNIIGYCHIHDLFTKPDNIRGMLNRIIIVTETMLVSKLMVRFIAERKSIALVVDEFGGTSGIVTIEDIIEEIFGEIADEYDEDELTISQIKNKVYQLSARFEVDILNEQYGFNIPEGDYETLGGYILAINHDIPKSGEVIENDLFRFEIKKMANARIDMVEVYIKQ